MSLAAQLRAFQQTNSLADPRDVAAKYLATVPTASLRDVLAEALPIVARHACTEGRNVALKAAPAPSAKVAAVRSWHQRMLAQSVDVSGGQGQWKTLGQCDATDLAQLVAHRHELARRNAAVAGQYDQLSQALDAAGATTVAELPAETLRSIFGGTQ